MNIYLMTNIKGSGGMGTVSYNLLKYLNKDKRCNIKILEDKNDIKIIDRKGIFLRYGWRQDYYQTFADSDISHNVNPKNKNVFLLSFDPNMISKDKINQINRNFLQIWCDSQFTINKAIKAGIDNDKIRLLKLGVSNQDIIKKNNDSRSTKKIKFVNISGHDMFFIKGLDLLIESFLICFRNNKNVELHIKTKDKNGYVKKIKDFIYKKREELNIFNYPKIIVDAEMIKNKEIFNFLKKFDCYIQCSRIETFGLPLLEASSIGLPVISPNFGGQLDFLNKKSSLLYPTHEVIMNKNSWRENRKCFCREGKIKDIAMIMKEFLKCQKVYSKQAIDNSYKIRKDWNWGNSIKLIYEYIEEIC